MVRAREVFLRTLVEHGVQAIFGNPGTTENPLLIGLGDVPELTYYVALHEGVAVCAAGAYAQATGRPAVANVHVAPGLGNAIGMMYGLLKSRSAVLVTAGQQDTRLRHREPLLGHDLVAMAAPVCKWAVEVSSADDMADVLARALSIAQAHPRGPVFVALPNNVMEAHTDHAARAPLPVGAPNAARQNSIQQVAQALLRAESPLIVVGDDVAAYGANAALAELAERVGAAIRTDFLQGRLSCRADHPNLLGSLPAATRGIRDALAEHDVVALVGGPTLEEIWFDPGPRMPPVATLLQIELTAAAVGKIAAPEHVLIGDLVLNLQALSGAAAAAANPQQLRAAQARNAALAQRRQAQQANFLSAALQMAERVPLEPLVAMHALAQALPPDAVIVDEAITANPFIPLAFKPQRAADFFVGRGGGIGQGIAGALGVAAAQSGRRTVAISGDGSAMYSIQALWSAAHHRLEVLFVILSNREYRILKHNVDEHCNRFGDASNHPYPHMDLVSPELDFVAMAQGMGVPAARAATRDEIAGALAGLAAGPFLLEIVVAGKSP